MCLDLMKNTELQIASENIICYKRIYESFLPSTEKLLQCHGRKFTGIILDIKCSGHIYVTDEQIVYFCTDHYRLDGLNCSNKLGYDYSWMFDNDVISIFVDDNNMLDIIESKYVTPYQHAIIEIGETYYSELVREKNEVNIGLHSFVARISAIEDGNGLVVKCVIPKGSEYYLGKFNGVDSFASNSLKYLEIISK